MSTFPRMLKFIGLLVIVFGVVARPDIDAASAQQSAPVLLALGDSLTAGMGATSPARQGYAQLLTDALRTATPGLELVNLSVPGETTGSFVAGGDSQLQRALSVLRSRDAQAVVITIGGNDLYQLVGPGQPCDLSRARRPSDLYPAVNTPPCRNAIDSAIIEAGSNLRSILSSLEREKRGPGPIIVALPYNGFRLGLDPAFDQFTDENGRKLYDAARESVRGAGSPSVKIVNLDTAFDANVAALTHARERDVHPNDFGHRIIAGTMLRELDGGKVGYFAGTPAGASVCPERGKWLLLYWRGAQNAALAPISVACPAADRFWISRQGRWSAFAPNLPEASDPISLNSGEAIFAHGLP